MLISDWSSDVCSSDLVPNAIEDPLPTRPIGCAVAPVAGHVLGLPGVQGVPLFGRQVLTCHRHPLKGGHTRVRGIGHRCTLRLSVRCVGYWRSGQGWGRVWCSTSQVREDRKSVESGKRVSVSVDLGGGSTIKKKKT